MLLKLKAIKFSESTIKWFKSYLSERIFLVNIENKLSDFGEISCGVPQGSILGLLLFLINEPMTLKAINKIYSKLKLLYRKNIFLSPGLRRTLCNALIQSHFDYACPVWYPNLTEKTKKENTNYVK